MLLGIILAGGKSRRMGTDKALLSWQGDTLLTHAQQLLENAGCEQILVSRNAPEFVQDIYTGKGPLAGVHACLQASRADEVIVIPIDMPLLSSRCLIELVAQGRAANNSCFFAPSVLPCYLKNTAALVQLCDDCLKQERLSLHGFLHSIGAAKLAETNFASELTLMNTNTPQQWALANQFM